MAKISLSAFADEMEKISTIREKLHIYGRAGKLLLDRAKKAVSSSSLRDAKSIMKTGLTVKEHAKDVRGTRRHLKKKARQMAAAFKSGNHGTMSINWGGK